MVEKWFSLRSEPNGYEIKISWPKVWDLGIFNNFQNFQACGNAISVQIEKLNLNEKLSFKKCRFWNINLWSPPCRLNYTNFCFFWPLSVHFCTLAHFVKIWSERSDKIRWNRGAVVFKFPDVQTKFCKLPFLLIAFFQTYLLLFIIIYQKCMHIHEKCIVIRISGKICKNLRLLGQNE